MSRPIMTIEVVGRDADAALIAERRIELTVTDEAGFDSDTAELVLDNRDGQIAPPDKGVVLRIGMGYQGGSVSDMGLFTVDEISSQGGGAKTLTIGAKATNMIDAMKVRRTVAWEATTLGGILRAIAGRHNLTPQIGADLDAIPLGRVPYAQIDQINESDLHFLRRLAVRYDAVSKPVDGALIFVRAGAATMVDGSPRPSVALRETDVTRWDAVAPDRSRYGSVTASYLDAATQTRQTVVSGNGEPVFNIDMLLADQDAAQGAADGKFARLSRANRTLSLSLEGRPDIQAEMAFFFQSTDPVAAGDWVVKRAVHRMGSSFTTRLDLETPTGSTT